MRRSLAALAFGALVLPFTGASGCADTHEGAHGETAGLDEPVGEAHQAATPVTCVMLRGGLTKAHDTFVSSEKVANNYGTSTVALIGAAAGGLDQFVSLFRFDTSMIPVDATVTSATVSLSQISPGVGTWNAHLITAPWSELTVTWASFGGAFNPAVFKSGSTANPTITLDVVPQLQGWVSGAIPNHGFALEQLGPGQTKLKTRDFAVAGLRPTLVACYKVLCPPGFADCNGLAADGCEADLSSPTSCGGCGATCAAPHASASCTAGTCGLGACDLGFGDCDGIAQNGCETSLATLTDCGGCGVVCALPGGVSSCASGSCKVLGCNAGAFDCDGNLANGCDGAPCADGGHCAEGAGCASQVCVGGFCASAACNDHTLNGDEASVDCGGACPPCADGIGCGDAGDCQSGVCGAGVCAAPTCADGIANGSETSVDCGGASCAPCADASGCAASGDCQSGVCLGGVCQAASCADGLKNGGESAVDCGGPCAPCGSGAGCGGAIDCQSGVCAAGVCQQPSCADGVTNGGETDVDCGGPCADCLDFQLCATSADCVNGVCVGGKCQPSTCSDGVKNGDETAVDCGGACAHPEVCNGVDDDCDGSVDEGLGSITCGLGACQVTVPSCAGGVAQACVPGAPKAEACDGALDDDCDGVVDNGCDCVNGATQGCYTGSAMTAGVGACHAGTQACALGHWGACAGEHTPGVEVCNGADDDCDGQTDEGLGSTICGVGACQVLVQNCVAGAPQACAPSSPSAEVCDGIDNDCNGQVDEGLPSLSCGVGACATTAPSCVNGAPGACNAHATDGLSCNDGHDCTGNDACQNGACAGTNLPAGTSCRASAGACDVAEACTGAAPDCPADARVQAGTPCRAAAGVCDVAESCNGVSTACPVNGFSAAGTTLGACVTGLLGVCSAGTSTCPGDAASASCVQNVAAGAEVCDGLDNNCNGQVDERGSTVLWHRFDDSASPVSDASGNGNTGVLSGPTYAVPTPDGSAKALSFASGNTYNVNSLANFNFGSQLTVQLWIKWVGQAANYRGVVGNGYFNTGGFEIRFGRESSGTRLGLRVNTVTGAAAGDLFLSTSVWHHVAMVYNGASLVGYLDGVQGFSTPLTGAIKVVGNALRVGNNVGGVSEPYSGLIDDLRIDTAALLPGQLALSCH